jgi:enoyl-CoA hydratase/carnithine racemase
MADGQVLKEFETLLLERTGNVVKLTFNRPESLNALNDASFREIPEAIGLIMADDSIRVVVVTGAGRGFCSGADVRERVSRRGNRELPRFIPSPAGKEWDLGFPKLQVPVIAAVNGAAAGAGFCIALMSDIRIAATSAFFVEAHTARGLTPSIAAWLLPRMVGLSRATEILLSERRVGAEEALALGLVTTVVPDGQVVDEAMRVATMLEEKPALALLTAKGALVRSQDHSMADVRAWAGEMELLAELRMAKGAVESIDF